MSVTGIVLAVILAFAAVVCFLSRERYLTFAPVILGIGCLFMIPLVLIADTGIGMLSATEDAAAEQEQLLRRIEDHPEDWTFYLEGEEVAYENVSIRQYDVSVDEEERRVFLAGKRSSSAGGSIHPVFLPVPW